MLFLLIPKVLKIAISLVFLVAICITEEDRLNEATTIIRNNVKKVIFVENYNGVLPLLKRNLENLYMDGGEVFNFSILTEPKAILNILKISNLSKGISLGTNN